MRSKGTLLAVLLLVCGCRSSLPPLPALSAKAPLATVLPTAVPAQQRSLLTRGELWNGFSAAGPVDEAALAMPAGAAEPATLCKGTLELLGEDRQESAEMLRGELPATAVHLPELELEYVQSGSYLIPVQRVLVIADHPDWNCILEPGRIWQEEGDAGDHGVAIDARRKYNNGFWAQTYGRAEGYDCTRAMCP